MPTGSAIQSPSAVGKVYVGLADWQCELIATPQDLQDSLARDYAAYDAAPSPTQNCRIFVDATGAFPAISVEQNGVSIDLAAMLCAPEGNRFVAVDGDNGQVYSDSALSGDPAIEYRDGAFHLLIPERMSLYLSLVMAWRMLAESTLVSVHAAVCGYRDTALVIAAPSGSGKSTLAWALRDAGAKCYTDEWAFLQPNRQEAYVGSQAIALRPGGYDLLGVQDGVGDWVEAKANDPKMRFPIPTTKRCPEGRVRLIFLTGFGDEPSLTPANGGDSVRRLMPSIGFGDPSINARIGICAELANTYPASLLKLGTPQESAALLLRQIEADQL